MQIKIIAEIGINHNGKIKLAKKLIDFAKKAGANFVKFQSYKTEDLIEQNEKLMSYQSKNMKKKINQFNMLKACELNDTQHKELINYCKKKSINFLSTPYSIERANFLIKNDQRIIKIASTDSTNISMIKFILKKKIKVIISTGATTLDEIHLLMRKINYKKNKNLITLLHCTSFYPAESKILNLDTIKFLIKRYKVNVGYSDHSDSKITGALAIMNGAKIIEKHITLSKKMPGPDHKASLDYLDFKKYIDNIKFALAAKGKEKKILSRLELNVKKQMQKSLIYSKNLKKNTILRSNFINAKRPANGISPLFIEKVLNKKLKKNVLKNKKIRFNDFF